MQNKNKKKNKILLTLGLIGDFLRDARDPLGLTAIPYKEVYGFIPNSIKKDSFNSSLSYNIKVGDIERIIKKDEVCFKITRKGFNKLLIQSPLLFFERKPWDKRWRVLIYDIPEIKRLKREALRKKICSLGFGKLQESVYISPFPIEKVMTEFLESKQLTEYVLFLLSDTIFTGGEKYLAESVWNLSKINDKYGEIYKKIKEEKEWTSEKIKDARACFIEILSIDPFLPKELLPNSWLREEVKQALRKLRPKDY